jgi:hypothetical protein
MSGRRCTIDDGATSMNCLAYMFACALILPQLGATQVGPQAQAEATVASAPPAIRMDATTIILPPGTFSIRELVDAAAKFLCRNILIDERELAGSVNLVTLQNTMRLERAAFEEVFCDLLHSNRIVLMVRDEPKGLYEVVSLNGPRAREAFQTAPHRSADEILRRPDLKQPVSTMLHLQRVNSIVASNTLRPLYSGSGKGSLMAGFAGGNDGIILVGLQAEVARAIGMLRQADGPPPEAMSAGAEDRFTRLEQRIAALQRELAELKQRLPAKSEEKR